MTTIDDVVDKARERLQRVPAESLADELACGAVLVDIRPAAQRAAEGDVPTALVIERNVLEWRCDPASDARIAQAADHDVRWIILCSEGYTSSLAAGALQDLGLHRATDVVGGYRALAAVSDRAHSYQAKAGHVRGTGTVSVARPVAGSASAPT